MEKSENENNLKILPVILSGGSGKRLWPLSRASFPKQYLNPIENNNYTLLQNTLLRLEGLENLVDPIVICNEEHRFIAAEQMRQIGVKPKSLLLEPFGRNTAPATTLAALLAEDIEYDPILLVLSSDHIIDDELEFCQIIRKGLNEAKKGNLVTFGVLPTRPETGYGYIEAFEKLTKNNNISRIKKFVEKPNKEVAEKMLKNKCFTWNSGIFLFKASTILNEIKCYESKIYNLCCELIRESHKDNDFLRIPKELFQECPNLSIDCAIMEKTRKGVVIAFDTKWTDIGSWKSIWEKSDKDKNGNFLKGKTFIKNVQESYIRSEGRLIVGAGFKNLIIVETKDAILVINKQSASEMKTIVKEIEKKDFVEALTNRKVFRPWGNYTSIEEGLMWQVKKLEIKPKGKLSLQMHKFRSEHWVIVSGTAKVEINNKISILKKNEGIYVPLGAKHRLSNPEKVPLILIEVQIGSYLGEDDITRFDDLYGRQIK